MGALLALACGLGWPASAPAAPLFREVPNTGLPTTGKSFGATWADVDRDGRLDFLIGHHGQGMGVYLNRAGLKFVRQDSCAILPCVDIDQHGTAACDYDNDGDWELYVTVGADRGAGTGPNQMWVQNEGGTYRDSLPPSHFMTDSEGRGRGALWVRLDADRFPELIVLNYQRPTRMFSFDGQRWQNRSEPLNPFYLKPSPNRRGTRQGRGLWFGAAAAGDLDLDGHCDLILDGDGHFLLHNDGTGGLRDETVAAGLPPAANALMSTALGDVDDDGDLDAVHVFRHLGGLQLWLNESTPGAVRFVKGFGLDELSLAPELDSAFLADLDNDGHLDLYVMMQDGAENRPNLLARGGGDGSFTDVSAAWGGLAAVQALPRGAWPVDLDGDGDLDLMAIGGKENFPKRAGLTVLYENLATNQGLTLELVTSGGAPHGLGARVALQTASGVQIRQVRSTLIHWNSTVLPLHFGLGSDPGPYPLVITWPNGRRQELSLPRGGVGYRLQQGATVAEMLAE